MAVFPNWDLKAILKHRKANPGDELFRVVNIDGHWRLSSVIRVMHTHLVTFEHVLSQDHQTQADRYRRRAAMHSRAATDDQPLSAEVHIGH
jgi:hypothetical protein